MSALHTIIVGVGLMVGLVGCENNSALLPQEKYSEAIEGGWLCGNVDGNSALVITKEKNKWNLFGVEFAESPPRIWFTHEELVGIEGDIVTTKTFINDGIMGLYGTMENILDKKNVVPIPAPTSPVTVKYKILGITKQAMTYETDGHTVSCNRISAEEQAKLFLYGVLPPVKNRIDSAKLNTVTNNDKKSVAEQTPPLEPAVVMKMSEAEVRQYYTDQYNQRVANEKQAAEMFGKKFDEEVYKKENPRRPEQIVYIGNTEVEKYPIAIVNTPTEGPAARREITCLTKISGKLYAVWGAVVDNVQSVEATQKEITINHLTDNRETMQTDKYVYNAGNIESVEDINPDYLKCLPNMRIHVPFLSSVPYDVARKFLIAEGWKPTKQEFCKNLSDSDPSGMCVKGYTELASSNRFGVGSSSILKWESDRGDKLEVEAESGRNGLGDVVISTSTTCQNPPSPSAAMPKPTVPAPVKLTPYQHAALALSNLETSIEKMQSHQNPQCQLYSQALYRRLAALQQYLDNAMTVEMRNGSDKGMYMNAQLQSQQAEMTIAQMGCK